MRQWWYQTCTEFGWYQITDNSNPAFGNRIPLEYFLNLCKEVYGDKYQQTYIENQVKHTNNRYGGTNIDTSRLILIHGSLDPWHQVGLYEGDNTKQYTVIFIEGKFIQIHITCYIRKNTVLWIFRETYSIYLSNYLFETRNFETS